MTWVLPSAPPCISAAFPGNVLQRRTNTTLLYLHLKDKLVCRSLTEGFQGPTKSQWEGRDSIREFQAALYQQIQPHVYEVLLTNMRNTRKLPCPFSPLGIVRSFLPLLSQHQRHLLRASIRPLAIPSQAGFPALLLPSQYLEDSKFL